MIISQQAAKKSPVTNMSRIIKRSLKTVAVTAAVSAAIVISVQQCFQSVLVLQCNSKISFTGFLTSAQHPHCCHARQIVQIIEHSFSLVYCQVSTSA